MVKVVIDIENERLRKGGVKMIMFNSGIIFFTTNCSNNEGGSDIDIEVDSHTILPHRSIHPKLFDKIRVDGTV